MLFLDDDTDHDGIIPPNLAWVEDDKVGPFRIKRMTDSRLAAELDLPPSWKTHLFVSIAELEPHPHTEDPFRRASRAPAKFRVDEDDAVPRPGLLLDRRQRRLGRGNQVTECRVPWERAGPEYDEWVREEYLPSSMTKKYDRKHP